MNKYTIYSTTNSDYQDWQCELLEYTFNKVGNTSKLIKLCSDDENKPLKKSLYSNIIKLPLYLEPNNNDINDINDNHDVYNKIYSLKDWNENYKYKTKEGSILLLEPDMIFIQDVNIHTIVGTIKGQHWIEPNIENHFIWSKY